MTNDLPAALEALLFIYGEPLDAKKAASVLGVKPEQVQEAVLALQKSLKDSGRGLTVVTDGDQFQLITRPDFAPLLEKIVKAELSESLTPAAIETLSIVAYGGPISRSEIDYIRGVNSSFILRALSLRGLVSRELDSRRSNAYLYNPSFDLLKHLGVSNVLELPEYEKFRELAMKVKNPPAPTKDGSATPTESVQVVEVQTVSEPVNPTKQESALVKQEGFEDVNHATDEETQAIE